jgi:hypothetical protein
MPGGVGSSSSLTPAQKRFFDASVRKFRGRERRKRLVAKGVACELYKKRKSKYTEEELADRAACRATTKGAFLSEDQLRSLDNTKPLTRKPTEKEEKELFDI